LKKLPFENLSWVKVYEWVAGDPRSKIPWDEPPEGPTNRPLYQLLQNDRELVLRLLDTLYAVRDIQEVFNRFSPQHTDVVIKRSGVVIPSIGVLPSGVHSDIDARFSSIGQVVRQLRNRRGRCSYTDHADFHEDVPHRDSVGHEDIHGDQSQHQDISQIRTIVQHRPLWVARYLPSSPASVFSAIHADHVDTHLDIVFQGSAPLRASHADRTVSGFDRDFAYLPFWSSEALSTYLRTGTLPQGLSEIEVPRTRQEHYDRSNIVSESPRSFRTAIHGDHGDQQNPVRVSYNTISNKGRSEPVFGHYPSFDEEEATGGLTLVLTQTVSHSDTNHHVDYHQDAGFGFHGDLPHHDSHADEFIHCDFTAPHMDYTIHTDYEHYDETRVEQTHADHQDHANISHQDQAPGLLNPCIHQDTLPVHLDVPGLPHQDSYEHIDYWSGSDPVPHGDSWGSHTFHSDFTISPVHFDHMDYGTYPIWHPEVSPGVYRDYTQGILTTILVNPHVDAYSINNHSDRVLSFPPGTLPHVDQQEEAEYTFFHEDVVRFGLLLSEGHSDVTSHGDKPHTDFIYLGQQHTDTPAVTGGRVHGDTIVHSDMQERSHGDHTDHLDITHCDYPIIGGHTDLHNDMPHADHDDHANLYQSGATWHQDIPHYDHLDHGDL